MKKLLFLLMTAIVSLQSFAIDRFVDPSLASGNGTTLFNTIASAVAASVNGDRILIVSGNYNEPTLTLNKSLVVIPQVVGANVTINFHVNITGFAGMKLSILGININNYNITATNDGGSQSNRSKLSIIDCKNIANLNVDQNNYELNVAKCNISGTTTMRYGNFVVSKTANLTVNDETSSNLTNSAILITNDTITGLLYCRNDDHRLRIYNNLINNMEFWKWNNNSAITNSLVNNDFIAGGYIFIPNGGVPYYNFDISNNLFLGVPTFHWSGGCNCNGCAGYYDGVVSVGAGWPSWSCTAQSMPQSTTSTGFPNGDVSGFFKWTYNGIDLPVGYSGGSNLVYTEILGLTGTTVDAGNPIHSYYDVDLTVNDRGRTGGPYSILNYSPQFNPSNGKAFVFDLEMPADLYPGQPIDIQAKGYHRN
jgi:hypothetical protein